MPVGKTIFRLLSGIFYPIYKNSILRESFCKTVAAGLILFCLLFLSFGCSRPETDISSPANEPSALSTEKDSSLSPQGEKNSDQPSENASEQPAASNTNRTVEIPDDLLGNATDHFIDTVSGEGEKEEEERKWNISEEDREKYTSHADILFSPTLDADSAADAADQPHYTFRYRFEPGTDQKWNVSHQLYKETTYAGMTRKIETVSKIVRRWKIGDSANPENGENEENTLFPVEYTIDQMRLSQQEEGAEAISYDSRTDETIPEEFRRFGTEKMIGVPLERFQIDRFGRMTEKTITVEGFESDTQDSRVTVPFPSEAVAVGQSWTIPCTFFLKAKDSTVRTVKGIQRFRLENVTGDLATIRISMTILSMVTDPYLEGQLAEKLCDGTCRFDMTRGEAVRTELEFSRTVPNAFGEATILVYRCRIIEELDQSEE